MALCPVRPGLAQTRPPSSKIEARVQKVERAVEQWQKGRYKQTRILLSDFQGSALPKVDPATLEVALRYLADAALLDPSLDPSARHKIADQAVSQLFARDAQWTPPPGVHGAEFYNLTHQLRAKRERTKAQSCMAERQACTAELAQLSHERGQLMTRQDQLQSALDQQLIVVEQRVARNRAVALIPAGVGHFYNGRRTLGLAFLGTELALGASALGLLLYRVYGLGCRRTQGFAAGSLRCDVPPQKAGHTQRVRNAEQALGLIFFGSVIADVVVAQITFKAHSVIRMRRTRSAKRPMTSLHVRGNGVSLSGSF